MVCATCTAQTAYELRNTVLQPQSKTSSFLKQAASCLAFKHSMHADTATSAALDYVADMLIDLSTASHYTCDVRVQVQGYLWMLDETQPKLQSFGTQ